MFTARSSSEPTRFGNPSYKSSTHLWGYKLKQGSREEELNRLLVSIRESDQG